MPDFDTDVTKLTTQPYISSFTEGTDIIATTQKNAPTRGKFKAFQFEHIRYNCSANNMASFRYANSDYPGVRKVYDGTTAKNAIFLPFFADKITSVCLDTAARTTLRYFFTATLSGCAIFVDRRPGNRLYVYHANTLLHSGEDEVKRKVPSWQHPEAIHRLTKQHELAVADQPFGPTHNNVGQLMKSTYLGGAADLRKKGKIFGLKTKIKNKDWLGGTFVVGIRGVGDQWTFHYQSWGASTRAKVAMGVAGSGTFAVNV